MYIINYLYFFAYVGILLEILPLDVTMVIVVFENNSVL